MRTNNVRQHAENLGQVRYLDQICNWPREREKRRKCKGGMTRVQSCKGKGAIVVLLLRVRTSAIFLVASLLFRFRNFARKAKVRRSMRMAPTEHHSNLVNISKVYYYKNKFSIILKCSGKNAKRTWGGWDSKTNLSICLQCFGLATPLKTKYFLYFMNIS